MFPDVAFLGERTTLVRRPVSAGSRPVRPQCGLQSRGPRDLSGTSSPEVIMATAVVAIFNASDDTVEMLEELLQSRGYRTANGHVADIKRGELDFVAFVAEHRPDVVIWDISPPYDKNWVFFQLLRTSASLEGCGVVVTTTHKGHLDALAGTDTGALEIIGKPYDLNRIVDAVQAAIARKHLRGSSLDH